MRKIKLYFSTVNSYADFYKQNGYALIENCIPHQMIDNIQKQIEVIAQAGKQKDVSFFNTSSNRGIDFLQSGDIMQNFYEPNVFDDNNELKYPLLQSLNKIGHAQHDLDPVFKQFSYNKIFKEILQNVGYKRPQLVQSMYIFKSSKIGQKVDNHSDNTFLITNPLSVMGIWVALEDATKDNGCMWGVPGSHREKTTKFFKRNEDNSGTITTDSEQNQKIYSEEGAVCLEAKKGTVILLHGDFSHFSRDNISGKSRHAYTMHFVESENTQWDSKNWIQRKQNDQFKDYYHEVSQQ